MEKNDKKKRRPLTKENSHHQFNQNQSNSPSMTTAPVNAVDMQQFFQVVSKPTWNSKNKELTKPRHQSSLKSRNGGHCIVNENLQTGGTKVPGDFEKKETATRTAQSGETLIKNQNENDEGALYMNVSRLASMLTAHKKINTNNFYSRAEGILQRRQKSAAAAGTKNLNEPVNIHDLQRQKENGFRGRALKGNSNINHDYPYYDAKARAFTSPELREHPVLIDEYFNDYNDSDAELNSPEEYIRGYTSNQDEVEYVDVISKPVVLSPRPSTYHNANHQQDKLIHNNTDDNLVHSKHAMNESSSRQSRTAAASARSYAVVTEENSMNCNFIIFDKNQRIMEGHSNQQQVRTADAKMYVDPLVRRPNSRNIGNSNNNVLNRPASSSSSTSAPRLDSSTRNEDAGGVDVQINEAQDGQTKDKHIKNKDDGPLRTDHNIQQKSELVKPTPTKPPAKKINTGKGIIWKNPIQSRGIILSKDNNNDENSTINSSTGVSNVMLTFPQQQHARASSTKVTSFKGSGGGGSGRFGRGTSPRMEALEENRGEEIEVIQQQQQQQQKQRPQSSQWDEDREETQLGGASSLNSHSRPSSSQRRVILMHEISLKPATPPSAVTLKRASSRPQSPRDNNNNSPSEHNSRSNSREAPAAHHHHRPNLHHSIQQELDHHFHHSDWNNDNNSVQTHTTLDSGQGGMTMSLVDMMSSSVVMFPASGGNTTAPTPTPVLHQPIKQQSTSHFHQKQKTKDHHHHSDHTNPLSTTSEEVLEQYHQMFPSVPIQPNETDINGNNMYNRSSAVGISSSRSGSTGAGGPLRTSSRGGSGSSRGVGGGGSSNNRTPYQVSVVGDLSNWGFANDGMMAILPEHQHQQQEQQQAAVGEGGGGQISGRMELVDPVTVVGAFGNSVKFSNNESKHHPDSLYHNHHGKQQQLPHHQQQQQHGGIDYSAVKQSEMKRIPGVVYDPVLYPNNEEKEEEIEGKDSLFNNKSPLSRRIRRSSPPCHRGNTNTSPSSNDRQKQRSSPKHIPHRMPLQALSHSHFHHHNYEQDQQQNNFTTPTTATTNHPPHYINNSDNLRSSSGTPVVQLQVPMVTVTSLNSETGAGIEDDNNNNNDEDGNGNESLTYSPDIHTQEESIIPSSEKIISNNEPQRVLTQPRKSIIEFPADPRSYSVLSMSTSNHQNPNNNYNQLVNTLAFPVGAGTRVVTVATATQSIEQQEQQGHHHSKHNNNNAHRMKDSHETYRDNHHNHQSNVSQHPITVVHPTRPNPFHSFSSSSTIQQSSNNMNNIIDPNDRNESRIDQNPLLLNEEVTTAMNKQLRIYKHLLSMNAHKEQDLLFTEEQKAEIVAKYSPRSSDEKPSLASSSVLHTKKLPIITDQTTSEAETVITATNNIDSVEEIVDSDIRWKSFISKRTHLRPPNANDDPKEGHNQQSPNEEIILTSSSSSLNHHKFTPTPPCVSMKPSSAVSTKHNNSNNNDHTFRNNRIGSSSNGGGGNSVEGSTGSSQPFFSPNAVARLRKYKTGEKKLSPAGQGENETLKSSIINKLDRSEPTSATSEVNIVDTEEDTAASNKKHGDIAQASIVAAGDGGGGGDDGKQQQVPAVSCQHHAAVNALAEFRAESKLRADQQQKGALMRSILGDMSVVPPVTAEEISQEINMYQGHHPQNDLYVEKEEKGKEKEDEETEKQQRGSCSSKVNQEMEKKGNIVATAAAAMGPSSAFVSRTRLCTQDTPVRPLVYNNQNYSISAATSNTTTTAAAVTASCNDINNAGSDVGKRQAHQQISREYHQQTPTSKSSFGGGSDGGGRFTASDLANPHWSVQAATATGVTDERRTIETESIAAGTNDNNLLGEIDRSIIMTNSRNNVVRFDSVTEGAPASTSATDGGESVAIELSLTAAELSLIQSFQEHRPINTKQQQRDFQSAARKVSPPTRYYHQHQQHSPQDTPTSAAGAIVGGHPQQVDNGLSSPTPTPPLHAVSAATTAGHHRPFRLGLGATKMPLTPREIVTSPRLQALAYNCQQKIIKTLASSSSSPSPSPPRKSSQQQKTSANLAPTSTSTQSQSTARKERGKADREGNANNEAFTTPTSATEKSKNSYSNNVNNSYHPNANRNEQSGGTAANSLLPSSSSSSSSSSPPSPAEDNIIIGNISRHSDSNNQPEGGRGIAVAATAVINTSTTVPLPNEPVPPSFSIANRLEQTE